MDFSAHESEYKLVGHLLNHFENDREIFTKLTFLDFQCPLLGKIYDKLKDIYSQGIERKCEMLLRAQEAQEMLSSYIVRIGNDGIKLPNPEAYALIIKEKSFQRKEMEKIRISESQNRRNFEDDVEEFCDYLEETAEEMRNLDFTKEYSQDILGTINRQMKQLIAKSHI